MATGCGHQCSLGELLAAHPRAWKAREPRLLGELPDAELARRTGRTYMAAFKELKRRGIPNPTRRRSEARSHE